MSYDAYGRLKTGSQGYGLQPKKKPLAATSSFGSSASPASRKKNLGGFFGNDALEDDDDNGDDDEHANNNPRDKGRMEINRTNKILSTIGVMKYNLLFRSHLQ